MTVVRIGSGIEGGERDVVCEWFSGDKHEKRSFRPEVLEVYER